MTVKFNFISYAVSCCIIFLTGCAILPSSDRENAPPIIAMGDMHGDYQAYRSLMLASALMNKEGNWTGGNKIFIQTGDIPDRGPDTRKIIDSLQKLERQAPSFGGKVIPLVGNHEAMNMVGNLRYVHSGEYAAFVDGDSEQKRDEAYAEIKHVFETNKRRKTPHLSSSDLRKIWNKANPLGKVEHQEAWAPDGYIGSWVAGNKVVVKVQGLLFAHGGLSKEYTKFTLEEINAAGHKALREQDWGKTSILRYNLGPLWYRGNVRGRKEKGSISRSDEISKVLEIYNATHIIIGHTRNEDGIRVSANGRVIQIDTGASAHYGGKPSYLRIEDGDIYAHTLTGYIKIQ